MNDVYRDAIALANYVAAHPGCHAKAAFEALGFSEGYALTVAQNALHTYKLLSSAKGTMDWKLFLRANPTDQNRHIAELMATNAALDALLEGQRAESTRLARMLACEQGKDTALDALRQPVRAAPDGWKRDAATNLIRWYRLDQPPVHWTVIRRFTETGEVYWQIYRVWERNSVLLAVAQSALEAMETADHLHSDGKNHE